MAALAPIPSASVRTATAVKPGCSASIRRPCRTSCRKVSTHVLLDPSGGWADVHRRGVIAEIRTTGDGAKLSAGRPDRASKCKAFVKNESDRPIRASAAYRRDGDQEIRRSARDKLLTSCPREKNESTS